MNGASISIGHAPQEIITSQTQPCIPIQFNPRPGPSGRCKNPSASGVIGFVTSSSMYGDGVRNSTYRATGMRGRQVQVGGQADRRVPAVRHQLDVVLVRHPGDPPRLGQAAALGAVRLDDVHRVIAARNGQKLCRRVSTSPVAIGTGEWRRSSMNPARSSGGNASSNQTTS